MLDKQFDNIINQKIGDAKIDVPKSDWNVFSQKLKVAMESTGPEDQLFDEAIKDKLAAASLSIPSADWGAFAPKLQDNLTPDISDADFDKIINDKVADANIITPTPDWNTFADKLADAQFDASIKEKVESPEIEIPESDWPIFAGILSSSMSTDQDISDAQFDSVIQDKLVDSNLEIPSSDWSAFSQKMQSAEISDQQMDQQVKSRLEDYSTNFEESHWAILREKMIQIRDLRRNLFGLKGFEAALSVLLFITFANFFADGLVKEPHAMPVEMATNAVAQVESNTNSVDVATSSIQENKLTKVNTNTVTNNNTPATTAVSSTSSNTTSVAASAVAENVNNNITNNGDNGNNGVTNTFISPTFPVNNTFSPVTTEEKETAAEAESNTLSSQEEVEELNAVAVEEIASLDLYAFAINQEIIDPAFSLTSVEVNDYSKNNGWNLYLAVGRNTNQIFTPNDTLIFNKAYSRKVNNLDFDIRVGKEIGDIEVMTGLAYQQVSYKSNLEEELQIDFDLSNFYSIDKIQYDFIKIPLNTRWNYNITKKFGFFADLGVSANILMKSEYNITTTTRNPNVEEPGTIPQPISTPVEDLKIGDVDFLSSAHAYKNYQDGLAEGASLKESLYGNLDSGIGIKFRINPGFETFARASMSQQLGEMSIGPNSDSFSTWGLQLGLKCRL